MIRFDREALARYSLRLGDVAETIRNKVQGVVATRFTEHERKIDVRTRLPEKDLTTASTLERLQINPGQIAAAAARAVATIEVADGPAEIRHVGGRRAEIVSADLAGLDLRGAGREIEARAEELRNAHRDVVRPGRRPPRGAERGVGALDGQPPASRSRSRRSSSTC